MPQTPEKESNAAAKGTGGPYELSAGRDFLRNFEATLRRQQESLGEPFASILAEHLDELYKTEDRGSNAKVEADGAASCAGRASTAGLGIWRRPRPPMFHLCTLDVYQTDRPLNKGVWEILGFEHMDTEQELFVLRRFSPAEPSGQTGEIYKAWRGIYEGGHMHIWRRGPDLLDPLFVMPNVKSAP
jgi:hypothetical protein